MSDLMKAYGNVLSVLKPQKQGTCGLYSFWFATLLLNALGKGHNTVVYPRGCEVHPAGSLSLRRFAKHTLGSGQGELLNASEIRLMIQHFGWEFDSSDVGGDQRKTFITESLGKTRPVMFSYLAGGSSYGGYTDVVMPLRSIPANRQCGPHWSLIIAEAPDHYGFIEPNQPYLFKWELKDTVLISNEIVDSFAMEETWVKPTGSVKGAATVVPASSGATGKTYSVTVNGRQALNNLLFAIR